MKKLITTCVLLATTVLALQAQKITKSAWSHYTLGGEGANGYYVEYAIITNSLIKESRKGSGAKADAMFKFDTEVAAIEVIGDDEVLVKKQDDTTYGAIYFQNITANGAKVFTANEYFKTLEEAKAYKPGENEYGVDWFTKKGFAIAEKQKIMPAMQKKDVIAFANYLAEKIDGLKAKMDAVKDTTQSSDEQMGKGLGLMMMVSAIPAEYAQIKGYHPFKSFKVIDAAMKKYKKDKEVKKILDKIKVG